jgi:hypothetical protein
MPEALRREMLALLIQGGMPELFHAGAMACAERIWAEGVRTGRYEQTLQDSQQRHADQLSAALHLPSAADEASACH